MKEMSYNFKSQPLKIYKKDHTQCLFRFLPGLIAVPGQVMANTWRWEWAMGLSPSGLRMGKKR